MKKIRKLKEELKKLKNVETKNENIEGNEPFLCEIEKNKKKKEKTRINYSKRMNKKQNYANF